MVFQRVSCHITESLRQLWCRGKSRCVRRWSALGSCETFGVGFNQDEEAAQGLWTREVKYPLHDFEKIKSYWLDVRVQRKMVNSIWSWSRAFLEAYIATKQTEGEGECFEEAWEIWGNSVLSTSPILTSLIIIRTLPGTCCYSNFMSFLKNYCFIIFTCMHVFVCIFVYHMPLVPTEAGRGLWISWNWSYSWLWAAVWMLRIDPRSSVRSEHAFNCWVVSPASLFQF